MPELPEMENYRILLQPKLVMKQITKVNIHREKSINMRPDNFCQQVTGQQIIAIGRRAKYLIFHLENGSSLLLHLMLGGWMYYENKTEKPEHRPQIRLSFDNDCHLYFFGLRLGYLHLLSAQELDENFADIGPEPLFGKFPQDIFTKKLRSKGGKLKVALLDQRFIAGIGNRYADEICWAAQLKPQRYARDLQVQEALTLYHSIQDILQQAIEFGGYMDKSLFVGDTRTGRYKEVLQVHGRKGLPCPRCRTPIVEEKISSRKTSYCPACQH